MRTYCTSVDHIIPIKGGDCWCGRFHDNRTEEQMASAEEDREQIVLEGWTECLHAILTGLRQYPKGDLNIQVRKEVDRIVEECRV